MSRFPSLRIAFYYASKGEAGSVGVPIRRKVEKLDAVVKQHFPKARVDFEFVGAQELVDLANRSPQVTLTLALAESPISSADTVAFVCLVTLQDYFEFITDGNGHLRRNIFEANVRDYQGRTQVNDEMQKSLEAKGPEDFWWLNNGITILARNASQSGKKLAIDNPEIVNGLQTSTEIFNYFTRHGATSDARNVLVRVIVPEDGESRDKIIKATNSQTTVQPASLRATDKIHRDIELYLRAKGLYYDRRKNYYKNEGKPRDKIIGIPHMSQAVMAILLQKPDTARARPSSLLKNDDEYQKVYNDKYPVQLYYVCAELVRRAESALKSAESGFLIKDRNNLKFYVAMHMAIELLGSKARDPAALSRIDVTNLSEDIVKHSISVVNKAYEDLGGGDQVAKGPELLAAIRAIAD